MAELIPVPKIQFFDANGNPLPGGKIYSYASGTLTTLATYADAAALVPNPNPVVLDAGGWASVFLGPSNYTIQVKTAAEVTVYTQDNVRNLAQLLQANLSGSGGAAMVGFLQAGAGAVERTVQDKLRDMISVLDFNAIGNDVADDTLAFRNAIITANATGKAVWIPARTYRVTASIDVLTRVALIGEGPASVIHAAAGTFNILNMYSYSRLANLTVRGPNVVGSGATPGVGVNSGAQDFVTVENVIIEQCGSHGLNSGGNSNNWHLSHVISRNNFNEGYLVTGQSDNWTFDNCQAYGNHFNGFDISGLGHRFIEPIAYSNGGSGASANDQDGFLIAADSSTVITDHVDIIGGSFYNNNTHGLRIQTASPGCVISNVRIIGVRSTGNGTGDGGSNPATRFGDGIIVTCNAIDPSHTAFVQDCRMIGCHTASNYRYGISVEVENDGVIFRTTITSSAAISHTGWTGPGGSVGIFIFGSNVSDTLIQGCLSLNNSTQFLDGGVRTVANVLIRDTTGNAQILPRLSIGTAPATTGVIGTPNNQFWYIKDSAGTDRVVFGMGTNDAVVIRGGGGTKTFALQSMGGVEVLSVSESTLATQMGGAVIEKQLNFANGDTTPSVAGGNVFFTGNTAGTTITAFDDGIVGQMIIIVFLDANTTVIDGGTLYLNGNMVGAFASSLTLVNTSGNWVELARSIN